jgi:hypothetical protein
LTFCASVVTFGMENKESNRSNRGVLWLGIFLAAATLYLTYIGLPKQAEAKMHWFSELLPAIAGCLTGIFGTYYVFKRKSDRSIQLREQVAPTLWGSLSSIMSLLAPFFDRKEEPKSLLSFLAHIRKNEKQFEDVEKHIRLIGLDLHQLQNRAVSLENWKEIAGEFDEKIVHGFVQICETLGRQRKDYRPAWKWGTNENGMEQVYESFVLVWEPFLAKWGIVEPSRSLRAMPKPLHDLLDPAVRPLW